jgi:ribosomal protein S27E
MTEEEKALEALANMDKLQYQCPECNNIQYVSIRVKSVFLVTECICGDYVCWSRGLNFWKATIRGRVYLWEPEKTRKPLML